MKKIVTLLVALLLFAGGAIAEQGKGDASSFASKLKNKVLLTEEQTIRVESILKSYLSIAPAERNTKGVQFKIDVESLLNERQKAKYDIIKDNWWAEVNKSGS